MALVTWLGVWPSVYVVTNFVAGGALSNWPMWWAVGGDTLVVVILLTWVVMPFLTKIFRVWLSPTD